MNRKKKSIINIAVYIIMLIINYLGASGFINGLKQKDVSDMFHTSITPAGFTFSIWGVIYLLILISLINMYFNTDIGHNAFFIDKISNIFILSCIFNILWIISFSYVKIFLSLIFIIFLMVSILLILIRISDRYNNKILYKIAFGLYGGWLLAASFVNAAAYLTYLGAADFNMNSGVFALISLLLICLLSLFLYKYHKNLFYYISIIWAFIGIIAESKFYIIGLIILLYILGILYILKKDNDFSYRKLKDSF